MSKWLKGKVQWFDKSSGEGMILDEAGESHYVHYSIIVPKTDLTETTGKRIKKNLVAGKTVKLRFYENLFSKRVDQVKEL
ncbi:MAG: hypothetical protein AB8G05_24210 [Oligoflexales bacterium]